jgi:hypothetical protein
MEWHHDLTATNHQRIFGQFYRKRLFIGLLSGRQRLKFDLKLLVQLLANLLYPLPDLLHSPVRHSVALTARPPFRTAQTRLTNTFCAYVKIGVEIPKTILGSLIPILTRPTIGQDKRFGKQQQPFPVALVHLVPSIDANGRKVAPFRSGSYRSQNCSHGLSYAEISCPV